jgi:hypothetical protein
VDIGVLLEDLGAMGFQVGQKVGSYFGLVRLDFWIILVVLVEMDGEIEVVETVRFGGDHKGNMICSEGDLGDGGCVDTDVLEYVLEIIGGLVLVVGDVVLIDVDGCVVFDGGCDGGGELPHSVS